MINGIDFEWEQISDTAFLIKTPSFSGYSSHLSGLWAWRVVERDTHRMLEEGNAQSADEATSQMTRVMAENLGGSSDDDK